MKQCISLLLFFALIRAASTNAQQTNGASAQQLVERMLSTYVACKTYQDAGEVRTVFLDERGKRTTLLPFSTAFVRPASFRFEFRSRRGEEEWDQYIIWRQNEEVKSWWSIRPNVITDRSFSMSVSGATGVSNKASLTVPSMLMPEELRANPFKALTELKLLGEEKIGEQNAHKLEGLDFRGQPVIFWVDQQRFVLLRVFEKRKVTKPNGKGEFETETTTTYNPQLNEDVPASKLVFNPPVPKQ